MFTKQHYKPIADILSYHVKYNANADSNEDGSLDVCIDITNELADYFATDNSEFNKDKFLKACGVSDNC